VTRLRICLFFLVYSSVTFADPTQQLLDELTHRLVVGPGLQGSFHQEKHLTFLSKPFASSGQFSLDRSAGLRWQVMEPIESLMLVHGSKVILDGEQVKDHGLGKLMTMIMLGFMKGDLTGVSKYFDITGGVSDGGWQLSLAPLSSRLKGFLGHIDLRGDEYLEEILIYERDNNRTVIILSNIRTVGTGRSSTDVPSTL
jgi:outer membrane lipoprotein carrier protein LolA